MKIIPKTILNLHPDKPGCEAGKPVDVKKEIAEDLLNRGLVELPETDDQASEEDIED